MRNVSYSSPATVYVALYSTAPTAATSGTELSGSGYTRESVTFDTPTAGTVASNVAVSFGAATADWLPAVAIAVTDASTSGNIMWFKSIATQVVKNGNTLDLDSGDITITIS